MKAAIRVYRHTVSPSVWTARLDWFRRIEFVADTPASGPVMPGAVVVQDLRTGAWYHGVEALRRICAEVPLYWPAGLLLSVPPIARWFESYSMEAGIRLPV